MRHPVVRGDAGGSSPRGGTVVTATRVAHGRTAAPALTEAGEQDRWNCETGGAAGKDSAAVARPGVRSQLCPCHVAREQQPDQGAVRTGPDNPAHPRVTPPLHQVPRPPPPPPPPPTAPHHR